MSQTFSIILIIVSITLLAANSVLIWQYWLSKEQEVKAPEEEVAEEIVEKEELEEETVRAWDVFQNFLEVLNTRDLEGINTLVYKKVEPEEWENLDMSKDEYLDLAKSFYSKLVGEFQETDFVNVEEDVNQIVMSTDAFLDEKLENEGYTKVFLHFVKDSEGNILLLRISKQSWFYDFETAQKVIKDTDKDGLTDQDEMCTGAKQYDPECVKTDLNLKDTDGDGWWDSIELEAETDPNDPGEHPY